MYLNKSNPSRLGNMNLELANITEGSDIFNSGMLFDIIKFPLYRLKSFIIENKSNTPTSIANLLYGSQEMSWLLIIFNPNLSWLEYNIGDEVKYPDKSDLINFLNHKL
jgi:hypothetical protein